MLERELDDIDIAETRELFLGNQRRDRNQKRQDIIERINVALSDYGEALLRILLKLCLSLVRSKL